MASLKRAILYTLGVSLILWTLLSIVVEFEAVYRHEDLAVGTGRRALIIFHPSWTDHFQEDLTFAFAQGLKSEGWSVARMTANSTHLPQPQQYDLIVFGTNTYYWRPDLPTRRVLSRIDLQEKPVAGIVSGGGSTARAERVLLEAIKEANGKPLEVRSFWLYRPNDESRMSEDNRAVAIDKAKDFGKSIADKLR